MIGIAVGRAWAEFEMAVVYRILALSTLALHDRPDLVLGTSNNGWRSHMSDNQQEGEVGDGVQCPSGTGIRVRVRVRVRLVPGVSV